MAVSARYDSRQVEELVNRDDCVAMRKLLTDMGEDLMYCDMYGPYGSEMYHDFTGPDTSDVRTFLREVRRTQGPIAELAAGSGRITVPLLTLGRPVTAVDLSGDMLAILRARVDRMPAGVRRNLTVAEADMAKYRSARKFGVVVVGATSLSLLDPDARPDFYRGVLDLLVPGGRLVLSTVGFGDAVTPSDIGDFEFRGASGAGYRILDVPTADGRSRITAAVPDLPVKGTRIVAVSSVGLLRGDTIAAEMRDAGFRMVEDVSPSSGGTSPSRERYRLAVLSGVS